MKAIALKEYGSPPTLEYIEKAKPTPKSGEVLVAIKAASINAADRILCNGMGRMNGFGFLKANGKTPGADVAGIVAAVGDGVTTLKLGEEVFADLSGAGFQGYADFVCAPESAFATKPKNLSFEEAAALPLAGLTAFHGLKKAKVKPNDHVLIYGASGGVGNYAVQMAKAKKASVTAVCSTKNVKMVRGLGADLVVDYTKEAINFPKNSFDSILAINGDQSWKTYKHILKPGGICVVIGGTGKQIVQALMYGKLSQMGNKRITSILSKPNRKDLEQLSTMAENGDIKPIIDHTFLLENTQGAFEYLEKHHASGKVVLTVV